MIKLGVYTAVNFLGTLLIIEDALNKRVGILRRTSELATVYDGWPACDASKPARSQADKQAKTEGDAYAD